MINVRDSLEKDLPAIQKIYALEVLEGSASFETEPPDDVEMGVRRQELLDQGYPYLVATIDEQVAGYCYAGPYRSRRAYRHSVENSVYVARWAQHRGVAMALLSELIKRLKEGEWQQVISIIGDSGNAPSIGLHEKAGFRHVGTLRNIGFKHEKWIDTVLMQLEL